MNLLQWLKLQLGIGPLGQMLRGCEQSGSSQSVIDLLQAAQRIAKNNRKATHYLRDVRWCTQVKVEEISQLRELAKRLGNESREEECCLLQVVHAATVASCLPDIRYNVAIELAWAAKASGKYEVARRAYRDAWDSIPILARSVTVDKAMFKVWFKGADSSIRKNWELLNAKSGKKLAFLDFGAPDVAEEWLKHVEWNSDLGEDSGGLIAQSDATERLAVCLVQWCCTPGHDLATPVKLYVDRSLRMNDKYVAARYLVTLGDALARIGEFGHALTVHSAILAAGLVEEDHPISFHAIIQAAYCQFMLCDPSGCRVTMSKINDGQLRGLADLVVTYGDEYLRYLALEDMLTREPAKPADEVVYQVQKRFCGGNHRLGPPKTARQSYLLGLYNEVFEEDLNKMLDGEIDRNTFYVPIGKPG